MNNGNSRPTLRVLDGTDAKEYLKKKKRQALGELKQWKAELCKIIAGANLEFNKDGSYQFILPSRLVKLVWATTIKERVKVELVYGVTPEQAKSRAMAKLIAEVEEAHSEMVSQPKQEAEQEGEKRKQEEQEEEEARAELAEYRMQLIKEKEESEAK